MMMNSLPPHLPPLSTWGCVYVLYVGHLSDQVSCHFAANQRLENLTRRARFENLLSSFDDGGRSAHSRLRIKLTL